MMVDFITIARGDDSGYRKADRIVIGSKEKWCRLWGEHTSNLLPSPPAPKIDFARNAVIAVFAGEKPSSGYSVDIVAIETSGSETLVVKIKYGQPGDIAEDVMTRPYQMVLLPKMDVARVIFEEV